MSFNMYIPTRTLFGAGLIILSKAYFTHFISKHVCDDRFIRMAKAMGGLFLVDRCELSIEDCIDIYEVYS
ncbi:hypothetical protein CSC2_13090 [Clostridium zeae]|uniref:Uncharacterized protein n=1 Tax=Clostridium zeae TaxID=2759022 RepID=A0ABQ1E8G0_9CLOT|nr:hypothetical protein [Clostridium zeae]GFZ30783.1 hypothetical protein CSC2_13090 [Clostridium zeae]